MSEPIRQLCLAELAALPATVTRPAYDPRAIGIGIVHLGLGAFHRAHQAVYADDVLAADPRWGICGVSLKTPRVTAPLAAQQGLYTILLRDTDIVSARVVGALRETLFAGPHTDRVVARVADPAVKVVTLTVTEKGYCHDPASGELDFAHPDIVHDLATPATPVSVVGLLAAALAARRTQGTHAALNIVCCDNLPHNGRVLNGLVRAFAQASYPGLPDWIDDHVAFPSTMVDRIVPATTPADLADAQRMLGVADAAPVVGEVFTQWVIEDRFVAPRPRWETAGAQIVAEVAPFETMKLRLLNGSHSTLAYLGYLLRHEFIWQAATDPDLAALVERQMANEIVPTLVSPVGVNLAQYRLRLMRRFRNASLPHRTRQVAMDGSQKMPQRLLATVRDRLSAGASFTDLAFAVAGWIRYASGFDEAGNAIEVADPLAATFAQIVRDAGRDPARIADGFLDLQAVFGNDLKTHLPLREAVRRNVTALFRQGTRAALGVHLRQAG